MKIDNVKHALAARNALAAQIAELETRVTAERETLAGLKLKSDPDDASACQKILALGVQVDLLDQKLTRLIESVPAADKDLTAVVDAAERERAGRMAEFSERIKLSFRKAMAPFFAGDDGRALDAAVESTHAFSRARELASPISGWTAESATQYGLNHLDMSRISGELEAQFEALVTAS